MGKIITITLSGTNHLVASSSAGNLRKAPLCAMAMVLDLHFPMHPISNGLSLYRSTTIILAL
jgi:hypothetical protein